MDDKIAKIHKELEEAGITSYGKLKREIKILPEVIHDNETIHGVIYGQYEGGSGMMLITDQRILLVDAKLLNTITEESNYQQFMDVRLERGTVYSKVTVRMRAKTFKFKYVNPKAAVNFVGYLEKNVMNQNQQQPSQNLVTPPIPPKVPVDNETKDFIKSHGLVVVSTVTKAGQPYGTVVYYFLSDDSPLSFYIVTKESTGMAINLRANQKVAATIVDKSEYATLQAQGVACQITDHQAAYSVLNHALLSNSSVPKGFIPPIAQIERGAYVVYRIDLTDMQLHRYAPKQK